MQSNRTKTTNLYSMDQSSTKTPYGRMYIMPCLIGALFFFVLLVIYIYFILLCVEGAGVGGGGSGGGSCSCSLLGLFPVLFCFLL